MLWDLFGILTLVSVALAVKDTPGPYPQACSNNAFSKSSSRDRFARTYWYSYDNSIDLSDFEKFATKDFSSGTLVGTSDETTASWSQTASQSGTLSSFSFSEPMDLTNFCMIQTGFLTSSYEGLYIISYSDISGTLSFQIGKGEDCGDPADVNNINPQIFVSEGDSLFVAFYVYANYNYPFRVVYANSGNSKTSATFKGQPPPAAINQKSWNQLSVYQLPDPSSSFEDPGIARNASVAERPLDIDIGVACIAGKSGEFSNARYTRIDWYQFGDDMDNSNLTEFALSGYRKGDYVGVSRESTTQWSFSVTPGVLKSPNQFKFDGLMDLSHFAFVQTSLFSTWFGGLYTWRFSNIQGSLSMQYGAGRYCGDPRDGESMNNNVYTSVDGYMQVCVYVSTAYIFPIRIVYSNNGNTMSSLNVLVTDNSNNAYSNWDSYVVYRFHSLGEENTSPTYDYDLSRTVRSLDDPIPYPCFQNPQTDRKYARTDFYDFPWGNNVTSNITEFSHTGYLRGIHKGANKETIGSWSQNIDNSPNAKYGSISDFSYRPSLNLSQVAIIQTSFFNVRYTGIITFEFSDTQVATFQIGMGAICGDPRNAAAINNNLYISVDGYIRVTLYMLSGMAYPIRLVYVNNNSDRVSMASMVTDADGSRYNNWPYHCSYYMPAAGSVIEYPDYHYLNEFADRLLDDEQPKGCEQYQPEGDPTSRERYARFDWYNYEVGELDTNNLTTFALSGYLEGNYIGSGQESRSSWTQTVSGSGVDSGSLRGFDYSPTVNLNSFAIVMTSFFLADRDGSYTFDFSAQSVTFQIGYGTSCGDPRNSTYINNNVYSGYDSLSVTVNLAGNTAYPIRIVYANNYFGTKSSFSLMITKPVGSTSNWPNYMGYVLPIEKQMRLPHTVLPTITGPYGPEQTTLTTIGEFTNSNNVTTNGTYALVVEGYKTVRSTEVDGNVTTTYTTSGPFVYNGKNTTAPHVVVVVPTKYPRDSPIPGNNATTYTTTDKSGPHVVVITPYSTVTTTKPDVNGTTFTSTGPYMAGNSSTTGPHIVVVVPTKYPIDSPIPGRNATTYTTTDKSGPHVVVVTPYSTVTTTRPNVNSTTFTTTGAYELEGKSTSGAHILVVVPYNTVRTTLPDVEATTFTTVGPYLAGNSSTTGEHIVVVVPTTYPRDSPIPGDTPTTYTTTDANGPHVVIVTPYDTVDKVLPDVEATTFTTNGTYSAHNTTTSGPHIVVIHPTTYPRNSPIPGDEPTTYTTTGPDGPSVIVVTPYATADYTVVDAEPTTYTADGPYIVGSQSTSGPHVVVIHPTKYPTLSPVPGPEPTTYTTQGENGPEVVVVTPYATVVSVLPDVQATTYTTDGQYTLRNGSTTTGEHLVVIVPTTYPTGTGENFGPTGTTFTTDGPYTLGNATYSGPHVVVIQPYLTFESTQVDVPGTTFTTGGEYVVDGVTRTGPHVVVINPTHFPTLTGFESWGPQSTKVTLTGPYTEDGEAHTGPYVVVVRPYNTVSKTIPDVQATTYTTTGPYVNEGKTTTGPHVEVVVPTTLPTISGVVPGPYSSLLTTDGPYTVGSEVFTGTHVVRIVSVAPSQACSDIGNVVGNGFGFKLYNVNNSILNSTLVNDPASHLDSLGTPFNQGLGILNNQQLFDYAQDAASPIVAAELTGYFIPDYDDLYSLNQDAELISSLQFGAGPSCSSNVEDSVTDDKIIVKGGALRRRSAETRSESNYFDLKAGFDYPVRYVLLFRKTDRNSGLSIKDSTGRELDFSSVHQLEFPQDFPTIWPSSPVNHPQTYTSLCPGQTQSICVYVTGEPFGDSTLTVTDNHLETVTDCSDAQCTKVDDSALIVTNDHYETVTDCGEEQCFHTETSQGEVDTTYTTCAPYVSGTVTMTETHVVVVECTTASNNKPSNESNQPNNESNGSNESNGQSNNESNESNNESNDQTGNQQSDNQSPNAENNEYVPQDDSNNYPNGAQQEAPVASSGSDNNANGNVGDPSNIDFASASAVPQPTPGLVSSSAGGSVSLSNSGQRTMPTLGYLFTFVVGLFIMI